MQRWGSHSSTTALVWVQQLFFPIAPVPRAHCMCLQDRLTTSFLHAGCLQETIQVLLLYFMCRSWDHDARGVISLCFFFCSCSKPTLYQWCPRVGITSGSLFKIMTFTCCVECGSVFPFAPPTAGWLWARCGRHYRRDLLHVLLSSAIPESLRVLLNSHHSLLHSKTIFWERTCWKSRFARWSLVNVRLPPSVPIQNIGARGMLGKGFFSLSIFCVAGTALKWFTEEVSLLYFSHFPS